MKILKEIVKVIIFCAISILVVGILHYIAK